MNLTTQTPEITWETFLSLNSEKLWLLILFALSWILFFIFRNSAPAYLKKKGENLAQKQDIEELTTLLKKVEQEFVEKTEKLRTQLLLNKELIVSLHFEERKTIFEIHSTFYLLLQRLTDLSYNGKNFESNEEIKIYKNDVNNILSEIVALQSKIDLFNDDSNLREQISKNLGLFLQCMVVFYTHLNNYQNLNNKYSLKDSSEKSQYYAEANELELKFNKDVFNFIHTLTVPLLDLTVTLKNYLKLKTNQ